MNMSIRDTISKFAKTDLTDNTDNAEFKAGNVLYKRYYNLDFLFSYEYTLAWREVSDCDVVYVNYAYSGMKLTQTNGKEIDAAFTQTTNMHRNTLIKALGEYGYVEKQYIDTPVNIRTFEKSLPTS